LSVALPSKVPFHDAPPIESTAVVLPAPSGYLYRMDPPIEL
jgi:hypothetical protein